jgi:sigma-B regulation protein RsbU (phosphoserine phosphatase)
VISHPISLATVTRSVLVIDDSAELRHMISTLLGGAGYRPLLADTALGGLALLGHDLPSLILVDSELGGPELVRFIRRQPHLRDVPIIFLSSSAREDCVDEAFAAGASDYVVKPFDRRILLARISSLIRAAEDRGRVVRSKPLAQRRDQLLADFEEASRVQRTQSTGLPRCFHGGTIMGATVPCHHIGGDLITVLENLGPTTTAVVVDVAGHGVAAALVASSLLAELRHLAQILSIEDAIDTLNQQMTASRSDHYACVGAIQMRGTRATIVNAGLPPICVVRDGRIAVSVEASGIPPGMFDTALYEAVELDLRSEDRIVIMSDGLTEPLGDADDVGRCLEALDLLVPRGVRTSEEFARQIRALFGGRPLVDDATLIVIDLWFDAVAGALVPR